MDLSQIVLLGMDLFGDYICGIMIDVCILPD